MTLPGDAARADRPPAPDHADAARDRGHLRRARLPGDGRARGRARLLQLHRAEPPARAPRADGPGHVLRRPREPARGGRATSTGLPPGPQDVLLRTHTSPNQVRAMEAHEPAALHHRARHRLPAGHDRRHAPAGVLAGRGPGGRGGHHARGPRGNARGGRAGALRTRARDASEAGLLPVHRSRACRSTSPASAAAAAAG